MSSFFSLGGKNHEEQDQQQAETNYSLFLPKNEDIYNKGFELWQQSYQFQVQQQKLQSHQSSHQHVGFFVGPSNNAGGDEPPNCDTNYYRSAGLGFDFKVMNQLGRSGNDDGLHCQDCGNHSKRDCAHMRCRTCCTSRGYPCPTHVKSTWVPAAKRRERVLQQQLQQDQRQVMTIGGENPKRLRDNTAAGGGGSGGDGFELGHFPPELNSPAVFRCVRVSAMDDGDEQLAYQTAVSIGGHVFKGILYDQGPASQFPGGGGGGGGEGPSGSRQQPPLDLIAGGGSVTTSTATAATSNMLLDPSIYSPHLSGGFMPGTQFFLPPRH
ncbi:hypothetical protein OROHE_023477 [Orobanche hederae]